MFCRKHISPRIVINKALALRRERHRDRIVVHLNEMRPDAPRGAAYAVPEESAESPEQSTTRTDMRRLLERKIDELPVAFRSVFALRELEELSVAETAACLSIPEATVRSRLFRARGMLRESLAGELDLANGAIVSSRESSRSAGRSRPRRLLETQRSPAASNARTEELAHENDWCRHCDKPVPHDRSGGRRGAQRRTDCSHRGHGEPGRHRRGQACRLEVAHQGRQGVRQAHDR